MYAEHTYTHTHSHSTCITPELTWPLTSPPPHTQLLFHFNLKSNPYPIINTCPITSNNSDAIVCINPNTFLMTTVECSSDKSDFRWFHLFNIFTVSLNRGSQLTENVLRILQQCSLKVMKSNVNRTFVQSCLVFNTVLKTFFKCYFLFQNVQRTFKSNIP